jgi:hypothetical protein
MAVYALLKFGIFFDPNRPIFQRQLGMYILDCHKEGFFFRPTIKQDLPAWVMTDISSYGEKEHFTLSNKVLYHICKEMGIGSISANSRKQEFIEKLCNFYGFPCQGVQYKGNKHIEKQTAEKLNEFINKTNRWDIIIEVPDSNQTKVKFFRALEQRTVSLLRLNQLTEQTNLRFKFISRGTSGYTLLSQCANLDQECELRKGLHQYLSKMKGTLQDMFLTSEGTTNKVFQGAYSLECLEKAHNFILLRTSNMSTFQRANTFIPHVIFPIFSLAYETTIMLIDNDNAKTHLYTCQGSRSISYELTGTHNKPKIQCHIICRRDGMYRLQEPEWNPTIPSCEELSTMIRQGPYLFHRNSSGCKSYKKVLPNLKKANSLVDALLKCIKSLKYEHIETKDTFGLILYIKELISSRASYSFNGYGRTVLDYCKTASLDLLSQLKRLQDKHPSEWTHQELCPPFCLKYKIPIGVYENKLTYLYSYNNSCCQVQCVRYDDYVEIPYFRFIYLCSSPKLKGYYYPKSHGLKQQSHIRTLMSKYSPLEGECFKHVIHLVASAHGLNPHFQEDQLEIHDICPESTSGTTSIHTHITNQDSQYRSIFNFIPSNSTHKAIIFIFPFHNNKWESVILHHPFQNKSDGERYLKETIVSLAPYDPDDRYSFNSIGGVDMQECESGFYMVMYMLLGHRCHSINQLRTFLERLHNEQDLCQKVKNWIFQIASGQRDPKYTPMWLNQIISSHD